MGRLTVAVPAPYAGVSQAPPQDRLPEACEAMLDCTATLPNGVEKRPPWVFKAVLKSSGANTTGLFQEIPRGSPAADLGFLLSNEAGLVVPHVFQLAAPGTPLTVTTTTAAQTYLAANNPSPVQSFRACSIEDFTFITNRTVQCANAGTTAATRPFEALIWAETGEYARKYLVTVFPTTGSPVTAEYQPSTGGSAGDALGVGTDQIANGLYSGAIPSGSGAQVSGSPLNTLTSQGYTVTLTGSLIYISHPTDNFTLTVTDDQAGLAMIGIKDKVQAFSNLPGVAVDGFVVEISQDQAGGQGSYFVQFESTGSTNQGIWNEVVQPGAVLGLNPLTLPVALVDAEGTFTLDVQAWEGRETGNPTLVPDPGFIGDYINDVEWWRGRLVLVYNGGVTLSGSDDPFKFYTTTLVTNLDSDPIGLLTPVDRKTFFDQAVTFDQRLFVFADRCQAAVTTTGGPPTGSSTVITTMAQANFTGPSRVQLGNHKGYFLAPRTSSSILYSLAIDRLSGLALEEDMSVAIPQYLPQNIDRATTWEADYITAYGVSGSNRVYLHVYREQDYQRIQNAYYAWTGPQGLQLGGMFFKNSVLWSYWVDPVAGAGYVFTLDTTPNQILQGTDSAVSTVQQFLDGMVPDTACTVAYSATTNLTTYTLPYGSPAGNLWQACTRAVSGSGTTLQPEAEQVPTVSQGAATVVLEGDTRSLPLWFGSFYSSYWIPTKFYVQGADKKPMHDGRLSLKDMQMDISRLGYFRAEVTIKGYGTRITEYTGYFQDDTETQLDLPPNYESVTLRVPLGGNAEATQIKFVSDQNLGFKCVGFEWVGDWNPRSRRVT